MANISSQANACGRLFVVAAEHRTCSGVDMDTAVTISLVSWDDFSVHSFAEEVAKSVTFEGLGELVSLSDGEKRNTTKHRWRSCMRFFC